MGLWWRLATWLANGVVVAGTLAGYGVVVALATLLTLRGCDDGWHPGWLLRMLWRLAAWPPDGAVLAACNLADFKGL
jgi:hypothetical protein